MYEAFALTMNEGAAGMKVILKADGQHYQRLHGPVLKGDRYNAVDVILNYVHNGLERNHNALNYAIVEWYGQQLICGSIESSGG